MYDVTPPSINPNSTGIILNANQQTSESRTLLGNDMRNMRNCTNTNTNTKEPSITHMVLLQEKLRVLQQLESDKISLLDKLEMLRYDFAYIDSLVFVSEGSLHSYSMHGGGLLDKWNGDEYDME
jgi:hypothetical protein